MVAAAGGIAHVWSHPPAAKQTSFSRSNDLNGAKSAKQPTTQKPDSAIWQSHAQPKRDGATGKTARGSRSVVQPQQKQETPVVSSLKQLQQNSPSDSMKLASVLPSSALQSVGRTSEGSDQTTLMYEEDWSSSSATEETSAQGQTSKATVQIVATASCKRIVADPAFTSTVSSVRCPEKTIALDKSRGRCLKHLADTANFKQPVSMISTSSMDLRCRRVADPWIAFQKWLGNQYAEMIKASPRTRRFLRQHATGVGLQVAILAVVFLLLGFCSILSVFVPSLPVSMNVIRFLEVPIGVGMAIRFRQVGMRMHVLCTPSAISTRSS